VNKTAIILSAIAVLSGCVAVETTLDRRAMHVDLSGSDPAGVAIVRASTFSVAGGGDTLAAIDKYGVADKISYISTGGGAFLEFVEGKTLSAVAMLEERGSPD
jgi:hypothetical protein